jgi:hypothetical protein
MGMRNLPLSKKRQSRRRLVKKASHDTQKPIHQAGPSGVRPCPCMQSSSTAGTGSDEASPHHAPPSPPDISARPRWHAPGPAAPVRKSANQSWWLFPPRDRVRPHVLTLCATRRGTGTRLLFCHLRLRGGRNHGPSPPLPTTDRRSAAPGRTDAVNAPRAGVSSIGDRRRAQRPALCFACPGRYG